MKAYDRLNSILLLVAGAMIALILTGETRLAILLGAMLIVVPFVYALIVQLTNRPKNPAFKDAPKVIHVHVPMETCDKIRDSAAGAGVTLAQFSSIGFTLAILLVDAIKSKGRIIVQLPNRPDQVIDSV